jgi:two-component system NarL family sensor kinase
LEGILSERVRISRSLHDDLGNRLSEIQLLAEQMICSQESQERVDPMLNRIHQRTLDATEALDSLVWLLRDVSESSIDFGRHVEWLARNYLSTCNVGLDFKILAGQDIEIGGRVRQLLIMANQELIRNVARHGRATQIVIQLRISADWVYYQIEDNGCGFSVQSALALGRGLSNFVNQVEGVGGSATVASQPGHSVIAVKMPRVLP